MKINFQLLNLVFAVCLSAFSQAALANLPLAILQNAVENVVLQNNALTSSVVRGASVQELCFLAGRLTTGLLEVEKASYQAELSNNVQAYLKILDGKVSAENLAKVASSDSKQANELLRNLLFAQENAIDLSQDFRKTTNILLPLIRKAEQVGDLNRNLQSSFCTKQGSQNFYSMIVEISEQVLELNREVKAARTR